MVLYRRRGESCRLAAGETLAGTARLPELLRAERPDANALTPKAMRRVDCGQYREVAGVADR
jgi:hypothetical protein